MTRRVRAALVVAVAAGLGVSAPGPMEARAAVPQAVTGTVTLPAAAARAAAADPVEVALPFRANLIALSFPGVAADEEEAPHVEVRIRRDGAWSEWQDLHVEPEEAPEGAEARAAVARTFTEPVWVGAADALQARSDEPLPGDVRVHAVNTKGDAYPRSRVGRVLGAVGSFLTRVPAAPAAEASPPTPDIITREEWGADESRRDTNGYPDYAKAVHMAFVHHTAGSNSYTRDESAAIVRSIYIFHTSNRGWSDIGYNFLVDRYGQIFEGRYGGMTRPVIGAHTLGFNTGSTGVSLMGTFTSVSPPSAMRDALQRLLAWKLDVHHVPPVGTVTMIAGATEKYEKGEEVTFHRISGHRDGQSTSCPGQKTYDLLPTIRSATDRIGHPKIYLPSVSSTLVRRDGDSRHEAITFTATFSTTVRWRLQIEDTTVAAARTAFSGSGTSMSLAWNGTLPGNARAPSGAYRWTLTASDADGRAATPASGIVTAVARHPDGALLEDDAGVYYIEGNAAKPVSELVELAGFGGQPAVRTGNAERARYATGGAQGLRDGTLLKTPDGTRHIWSAGALRTFNPDTVFDELGYRDELTIAVDAETADALPKGADVTNATMHPAGTVLNDGTNRWVVHANRRRPVTLLSYLSRYRPGESVAPTAGDLGLVLGDPILPRDGTLVAATDGGRPWLVSDGTKNRFASWSLFGALGYTKSMLRTASQADLDAIPTGDGIRLVYRPPFADDEGIVHEESIRRLAEAEITLGCGTARYCPAGSVTREQMAAFIVRARDLPPSLTDYFDDDDGSIFEDAINSLAEAEITLGCGERLFCPKDRVTRAEMATFLFRAYSLTPSSTDYFDDDEQTAHEPNINALAAAGVTHGCGERRFCPNDAVTRAEMASFIMRAVDATS